MAFLCNLYPYTFFAMAIGACIAMMAASFKLFHIALHEQGPWYTSKWILYPFGVWSLLEVVVFFAFANLFSLTILPIGSSQLYP